MQSHMRSQGLAQDLDTVVGYFIFTKVDRLKLIITLATYPEFLFETDSISKCSDNLVGEVVVAAEVERL